MKPNLITTPMSMTFNALNHYWTIGGSTTEVYSSARNVMVPVGDADYVAWASWNRATDIPDVNELRQVLTAHGLPLPAWLLAAQPTFIQPAVGTYSAEQLKAYNADARWRKEQGGIVTTAGFPIKTDDRSQAKITGTYNAQLAVPSVTTPWHDAAGVVHQLDAAALSQLNTDLLTHINDCFARSADMVAGIDGGTITTLEAIDAAYAAAITAARKRWLNPSAAKKEK